MERLLPDVLQEALAVVLEERLAGEACRGEAGRNDDGDSPIAVIAAGLTLVRHQCSLTLYGSKEPCCTSAHEAEYENTITKNAVENNDFRRLAKQTAGPIEE